MPGLLAEITPVVLTRDEEANIGRTLGQLRWAREVLMVDSESTDRTRHIAASFPNVRITIRRFDDFAVGSSRVDLQACKLEYSIVSPK